MPMLSRVKNADSTYRGALETALNHALTHLTSLDQSSVATTAGCLSLRDQIARPLEKQGVSAEQVIRELAHDVAGGLLGSAGGRFFAWVIGGSLPAALAADWLTSAWDQNAVLAATAPAAALVEEIAGAWLKDVLGLPADASFSFVTGCQMAHATCLAAARHALLAQRGWNVEEQGLFGAPPIRVLTSIARHAAFERAVRLVGLGRSQIVYLSADDRDFLRADSLQDALAAEPTSPAIVLLQAGDINIGAFDDFPALISIARRYRAWVHVDGAFGLWAAASPRYQHLVRGVELANSWATDGHKLLNVPFDCGYAFVSDTKAHSGSMAQQASYLTQNGDARDPMDWTPEWSRRARGFPTYAALRQLGREGVTALVGRVCAHAHALATRIGSLPGAQLLWEPVFNQGLVRFLDPQRGASDTDHDRHTDQVIAAVNGTGEAFFSGTTWHGRRAMRISVCNWQTSKEDVERSVNVVAEVLRESKPDSVSAKAKGRISEKTR